MMKKRSTNSTRRKQTRKYRKQRKTRKQCGCLKWNWKLKGGEHGQIPNYAVNTWNSDPNYAQISARNVPMLGGNVLGGNVLGGNMLGGNVLGNMLANFGAIDGQGAANTVLGNMPSVDGSPNVQPLINQYRAV